MHVELKKGEAVIFDDGLVHYSSPNRSGSPRISVHAGVVPKEMTPLFYYFDKDQPHLGFEVFEFNTQFLLGEDISTILQRPEKLKSIGFIENNNLMYSIDEFELSLRNGPEYRRKVMDV